MKILIVCSTNFYDKIDKIKSYLESKGHIITPPNCYDAPVTSDDHKEMTEEEYLRFFRDMYNESRDKVSTVDAILVLNYSKEKNGQVLDNYIGASTFLEMYEAFMNNKKIYMMNGYPNNLLYDEIKEFAPIILNGNIDLIN